MSDAGGAIHVLHVDDEPDFAEMVATYLEREGAEFQVETATSATEALERLDDRFDCVVSDHDMPGRDGIELLQAVRERLPDHPFILYTGKGSEEVASEAISAGVTDYLQKQSGSDQYALLANRIRNAVERHRARRAVRETEEWTTKVLEHSSDYVFVVDGTGDISYVSPSIKRVLGYEPDEITGSSAFEFTHPDDLERATEAFVETIEEPDVEVTVKFRARHADGGYRWLEVRGRNLLDDPVVGGVLVNVRDITGSRRQNQAFEEFLDIVNDATRSFTQQMAELLDLGVRFLDLDIGILSRIDPPDYRVEHVSTPDGSIKPGETFELAETYCSLVYEADGPVAFHSPTAGGVQAHPAYRQLHLESYLGEPVVVDGDRYGTLNFSSPEPREQPFTDGEQAFIRTLAEWVSTELSRQRSVEEVLAQRERLERQNARLEQFASIVSHDLKNPLSVAQGRVELARSENENEDLDAVARAHDRIDRILDDLLNVARAGADATVIEPVTVSEVLEARSRADERPRATVVNQLDRPIRADRNQLELLLGNLIKNAAEHGGPDVTITIGGFADGFFVEDDGPGIPDDGRESVFESGFTTKPDGTGFGLNVVRLVADAHDWTVTVAEGSDGGARFEIANVEFAAR